MLRTIIRTVTAILSASAVLGVLLSPLILVVLGLLG